MSRELWAISGGLHAVASSISGSGSGGVSINTKGIERKMGDVSKNIGKLAGNVENVSNSLDRGLDKVGKPLAKATDIQFEGLKLEKVELIKNLEQEILEFIKECDESGIALDISNVKLDFHSYCYISLKNIVKRYIELISFRAKREEDKYKERQEYIQEETNKLINELPPFMKKYDDYNYKHFFIDSISYALCKASHYEINVPYPLNQFSRNAYSITDCKGNLIDLTDDNILDFDGNEISREEKIGAKYYYLLDAYIKYEPIPIGFESVNYSKYFNFSVQRSIFYNGSLCRQVNEYFDLRFFNENFREYVSRVYDIFQGENLDFIPIINYYDKCLFRNDELWDEFVKLAQREPVDNWKLYGRAYYKAMIRLLKEKGIVDLEQVLKEIEEGKISFYFATNKPIEDIVKQINLNLGNERKFDEKYYEYLQDTIDEYMQILRDLKLQAIEIRRGNKLNASMEETKGRPKRRVYRRSNIKAK